MWKAIIKLIESWSYRCNHNWELLEEFKVNSAETGRLKYKTYIYRCTKCCNHKNIQA